MKIVRKIFYKDYYRGNFELIKDGEEYFWRPLPYIKIPKYKNAERLYIDSARVRYGRSFIFKEGDI